MTILEKIQAIIGSTAYQAHSDFINALIEMCKDEAYEYCNLSAYDSSLDNAVVQMVLERFNRADNEGVQSYSASDISETFIDGYSKSTLSMLNKHRKVKVI